MTYPLFPYQRELYEEVRAVYRHGARSVCVVLPTGGGKTRVCSEFIIQALRKGLDGPAVWVTHTVDLVDQARKALVAYGVPSESIGIIAGGSRIQYDKPVQVAIAASLIAIVAKGGLLPKSRLIVADEAHHFLADSWLPLLTGMRAPGGFVLLPTATPERSDGRPMGDIADAMVVGPSVKRLTAIKRLVPCLTIDPTGPASRHLAAEPLDAYQRHGAGRLAIVYGSSVPFLETEALKFSAEGIPATVIHAKTPRDKRRALLTAFENQTAEPLRREGYPDPAPKALMSAGTLVEGVDVPPVGCVILTQLHHHAGSYLQRGGRGLRACEGKEELTLVDLCGNREVHGNLEDAREYSLSGTAIRRASVDSDPTEQVCKSCGCVVERWAILNNRRRCPHCGELGRELTPIEVRERELEEAGRVAKVSSKAKTFLFFLRQAQQAGHDRGRAVHRYTSRYGDPPWGDREVWSQVKSAWEATRPPSQPTG